MSLDRNGATVQLAIPFEIRSSSKKVMEGSLEIAEKRKVAATIIRREISNFLFLKNVKKDCS